MEARPEEVIQIVAFDVGIRNFAFCVLDYHTATKTKTVRQLEVVDLGCAKSNKQGAIDGCIDLLDDIVFQRLDLAKKTVVLIEQQMTATMKAIQVAINVFFKMTARYHSMDVTTKYLSAKHKLALMAKYPEFSMDDVKLENTKYKQNKTDAVRFGLWMLKEKLEDHEHHAKVQAMKKKDDACDALLHAIYYAEHA